jgi:hypothetical protein
MFLVYVTVIQKMVHGILLPAADAFLLKTCFGLYKKFVYYI